MRFAIVRALFNTEITAALLTGAQRAFVVARVPKSNVQVYEVPGAFELPVAALWLAQSKRFDAVVCLGCVIRGETPHFYYIASACAQGIAQVALTTGVPIIFGVLTTDNAKQARARAGKVSRGLSEHTVGAGPGNKGYEAAQSALQMVALRKSVSRR